jgi:hypothetical protein
MSQEIMEGILNGVEDEEVADEEVVEEEVVEENDNIGAEEDDLSDIFGGNDEDEVEESGTNIFEEDVIAVERCGVQTGICVIDQFECQDVTYSEVQVEYANSESQYQYEGYLVSRKDGYEIRFTVFNERKVEFPSYSVNDLELKKNMIEIIKQVMPELVEDFNLKIRTCL